MRSMGNMWSCHNECQAEKRIPGELFSAREPHVRPRFHYPEWRTQDFRAMFAGHPDTICLVILISQFSPGFPAPHSISKFPRHSAGSAAALGICCARAQRRPLHPKGRKRCGAEVPERCFLSVLLCLPYLSLSRLIYATSSYKSGESTSRPQWKSDSCM